MRLIQLFLTLFGVSLVLLSGALTWRRQAASEAMLLTYAAAPSGEYATQIFTMWADGSQPRQLTHLPFSAWLPTWSPDGKQIAFFHFDDVSLRGLYIMGSSGEGLFSPVQSSGGYSAPHWTPNSEWITYESLGTRTAIFRIRRDGSQIETLYDTPADDFLATQAGWSPAGTGIVVHVAEAYEQVIHHVQPAEGSEQVISPSDIFSSSAIWSPDGEWIAYVSYQRDFNDVYRVRPDGSGTEQLTSTPNINETNLFWSPDSQQLLILSSEQKLYLLDSSGGELRLLTETLAYETAGWSPDGQWIVFTGNNDNLLYRIHPDGTGEEAITTLPGCCASWSPLIDLSYAPRQLLLIGLTCLLINAKRLMG